MLKQLLSNRTLILLSIPLICLLSACEKDFSDMSDEKVAEKIHVDVLSSEMTKVRDYIMKDAVIAHRGSTFWVPEETESAYRWARNIGVDYLELDIQMTSDGLLLALHDDNLQRTTNIGEVFPDRLDAFAFDLTYNEMLKLDAGSWFNTSSPNQARSSFKGEYISALEDVLRIAEGKRIVRNADGSRKYDYNTTTKEYTFYYENDPMDNGNRPGVYIEFKEAWMFPGVEQATYDLLDKTGWNIITKPATETEPVKNGKVNVGNTNGKVVLQTFSSHSLKTAAKVFEGKMPMCFLLWVGDGFLRNGDSPRNYADAINFAIKEKAHFTGPSIAGAPNNYDDILKLWQAQLTHRSGLKIHAYSFDTPEQMKKYYGLRFGMGANGKPVNPPLTDAMFTNRSEITINFYIEQGTRPTGIAGNDKHPKEILDELGYTE